MLPSARRGEDEIEDLAYACASCDLSKGALTESEWIGALGPERSVHLIGVT